MINRNVTLCLFNGVLPNYRDVPYNQLWIRCWRNGVSAWWATELKFCNGWWHHFCIRIAGSVLQLDLFCTSLMSWKNCLQCTYKCCNKGFMREPANNWQFKVGSMTWFFWFFSSTPVKGHNKFYEFWEPSVKGQSCFFDFLRTTSQRFRVLGSMLSTLTPLLPRFQYERTSQQLYVPAVEWVFDFVNNK